ncbi:MAG: DUF4307 domain-containing protein [Acidimicrobiia bacterium]|nr:DUF4307 domain-containing protein [Acidimicrobiia bacterium]
MAKCMKCGRPVQEGVSICRTCNPGHLPTPAPRQVHGVLAVTLIVAAVVMGLVSMWLFGEDSGNSDLEVTGLRLAMQTPTSRTYEITVSNSGETDAHIFCRLVAVDENGATLVTGRGEAERDIPAGGSGAVEVTLETAVEPTEVNPECA